MMDKHIIILNESNRRFAIGAVMHRPDGHILTLSEPTRTLDQNAKLWPMLADVSRQVNWYGQKLTADEWKDVFSASLKGQKAVPGIDGGFVICGHRTSTMGKKLFSDLVELIYAFGAQHGVRWSAPADYAEYAA
jgi:hypothetical protein